MILERIAGWAESVSSPLNRWVSWVARIVLFFLMFLTVADIVGRKFVGIIPGMQPVPGVYEITEFIMVLIVFTAVAYAQTRGDHIAIDVLTERFPKRAQHILYTVIYLVSLTISILVVWQSIVYGQYLLEQGDYSGVLEIPVYPFLFIVALGMTLYSVSILINLLKSLSKSLQKVAKE
ncbi:MAG TPA: TRAP transporter small permease [Dehalococcoidales bacterium]|nr:TRAP transporter small permease [Dehalococcoidales bacterium]